MSKEALEAKNFKNLQLEANIINELVQLLRPFLEDERNRRPFLVFALGNDAPVLQHISWGGAVASFIPDMMCKLVDYGEVAPGKQALWALLEYVRSQVGVDVQQRIDHLRPLLDVGAISSTATDSISIDVLVQKVRARLHDDIQSLHGTIPLLGVDHWVNLGELFVDVNILEQVSSSRKSELNDLWQDFSVGVKEYSSYRSLDRIGLGKQQQRISGLTVLAKNTNLMVLGKPGSGKTTYLQCIVIECNEGRLQPHRIPVLIKLREFVDDGRSFEYHLERYLTQQWRLSDVETELVLSQGRALILLDGLDEVTGTNGQELSKEIKRFARTYPQNQLIVTCRTQSQESRFDRFDYVEVADFNQTQVNAFAEHWFKVVCSNIKERQAKAREFIEKLYLEKNQPIRELAITPILLNLTCSVFHQTEKFYSKRSKLYEEGLELLLEKWDKSRAIERDEIYRELLPERKQELLSYLAVKKFEQPQYVLFEQEEIERYIAEFLKISRRDSQVVLRAIEAQHGLLIERAQKVWSFSHLTFQEYFVGKWFCKRADWQILAKHISEVRYQEIFLITTELSCNSGQLLKSMKNEIDYVLGVNKELQDFLARVYAKSQSVTVPYHPAKIRAFYFSINRNDILDFQSPSNFCSTHTFDIDINSVINPEYALDCVLDYELALFLYNAYCIASNPPMMDAFSYSHVNQQFIEGYEKLTAYQLEPEFRTELEKIKNVLPSFLCEDWESYRNWGLTEGRIWAERLRGLIVTYRNIRHSLHYLKDEQWESLKQYYDANKLLVDCLNSGSVMSGTVREEIENTLLLPITEIEKYKSTQCHLEQ
ncbi:NACHT domain-containing protein [Scytonema sp. UIC 10036]|uniref:NACHT C-terminal helical domain 2-containing protein n=1 Tax=Scytonema sp. UIC 10036 TaxID=2304196 RepID=UPI0012DA4BAC|nr:NACHT domain-containing protein [Scytonema sp. UIC 10036]MUG93167.1 NACHT domain-containing protein [Scytonema sp. UIC 10036]